MKINLDVASKYPYVLSVSGGIVRAVYKVTEWHYCEGGSGRAEFTGIDAEPEVLKIFLGKRIPAKYRRRGQASPYLYGKPDAE